MNIVANPSSCKNVSKTSLSKNGSNICSKKETNLDVPDFSTAIENIRKAWDLFYENKFEDAFNLCSLYEDSSLPYAHTKAVLKFAYGLLCLEPDQIEEAMKELKNDEKLCLLKKKHNTITQSFSQLFWRQDYDEYTDEEIHVYLCYAENQLMQGLLTFFCEQTIISMLKAGMKFLVANNGFKSCNNIMKHKMHWTSDILKREFECGVEAGIGTFNLTCSHMPSKILKLLQIVGFSNDHKFGKECIKRATTYKNCLRFEFSASIAIAYNLYMEHVIGIGEGDLVWAEELTNHLINQHPNSAFIKFFYARMQQVLGKPKEAIKSFNECIKLQDRWLPLHNICHWDICWSYAIIKDWQNAAKCAQFLSETCKWSRATNTYQYAVFMYHYMIDNNKPELKAQIDEAMSLVPGQRVKYAGKTIPFEKFVYTQALRYIKKKRAYLPAYELFYVWNIFTNTGNNAELINPILNQILNELKNFNVKDEDDWNEYFRLKLLKGVCLKHLGNFTEAIQEFKQINDNSHLINSKDYLIPHACLERGLTLIKNNRPEEGRIWIEKAQNNYSDYLIEAIVHLRAHSAIKKLNNK